MLETICKIALLVSAVLLIAAPFSPVDLGYLTGLAGLIILFSSMPSLGGSFKKPTYVFLILSLFLFIFFGLPLKVLADGVNSMLAVAAIVAIMPVFGVPIKVGRYDQALEQYLQRQYKRQTSLYIFLNLIQQVMGSFMLFGSIPMLFSVFQDPLKKMVPDHKRFLTTALGRSFSLVTLWAPGTINVVLVLEVTGVKWLQVIAPLVFLTILGLATSILLEAKLQIKGQLVLSAVNSAGDEDGVAGENPAAPAGKGKITTLVLMAFLLIGAIFLMERLHILAGTTRVIAAGLAIALAWTLRYVKSPELVPSLRNYWEKAIFVARDTAALFIAMGIFAEAVSQAGLIVYLESGLNNFATTFGQYSFLLIPPVLIILSLVGIHPFVSIMLVGKIFVSIVTIPDYEIYIALSLLLGGVISFVLSPFAGNVLTLARMTECSPREVSFKWNGLFSIVFLAEGVAFLFILQAVLS